MKYRLGDIVKEIIDYRGKTPKKLGFDWSESGIRAFSAKNIKTGQIVQPESIRYISEENYPKWMKQEVERGTILITSEAPFGQIFYWNSDEKIVLSQRLFAIKIKDEFDSEFVYYQMTSDRFQSELKARATGSTVTGLRQPELMKCEIDLPDLKTQKKIVHILSALDQKIELNNQQNNMLFDSVRAIFRNKYYQKRNDCSLSDYILTEINGDWGQDEKEENTEKAYCIRGADIPDMEYGNKGNAPSRYILEKRLEKKSLSEDDIIIEISGGSPTQSTGRTAYITQKILDMYDAPLLCTNFCKAIKVKNKVFAPFIYMYLKLLYEDGVLFSWENGTTGIKNLALNSLLFNTKVQSLNDKEAKKFYDQFYVIVNKISKNSAENMILIQTRDTLLPKLMSGEINLDGVTI